jgi:hypothetical protein
LVIARHFETDNTAADYDEFLGYFGKIENLHICNHRFAHGVCQPRNRRDNGNGACRDQEMFTCVDGIFRLNAKQFFLARQDRRFRHDDFNVRFFHLISNARDELANDFSLAFDNGILAKRHILGCDAERLAVHGVAIQFCRVEQCL